MCDDGSVDGMFVSFTALVVVYACKTSTSRMAFLLSISSDVISTSSTLRAFLAVAVNEEALVTRDVLPLMVVHTWSFH